jgi:citrate lyase beta subunit
MRSKLFVPGSRPELFDKALSSPADGLSFDLEDAVAESKKNEARVTLSTWMDAESWGEFSALLRLSGVADGDVARLVSQTADHLNQLTRLEKTHPILAQSAKVGRSRLLRPPFSEALVALD